MELWIRSQNREDLIKVDRLAVNDNRIEANFKLFYGGCDDLVIGVYETNERALEVLDEIHKLIKNASNSSNMMFPTTLCYNMPEE